MKWLVISNSPARGSSWLELLIVLIVDQWTMAKLYKMATSRLLILKAVEGKDIHVCSISNRTANFISTG